MSKRQPSAEASDNRGQIAPVRVVRPPAPVQMKLLEPPPEPQPETAEHAAERERAYRDIFGITEPKSRWRWRR